MPRNYGHLAKEPLNKKPGYPCQYCKREVNRAPFTKYLISKATCNICLAVLRIGHDPMMFVPKPPEMEEILILPEEEVKEDSPVVDTHWQFHG